MYMIILLINIVILLSNIIAIGHVCHVSQNIDERIDELSMIECQLVEHLDFDDSESDDNVHPLPFE